MERSRRVELGPFVWQKHELDNDKRSHHSATLVGGKLYIFGGYTSADHRLHNDILVVEPTKNGYRESKLFVDPRRGDAAPLSRYGHSTNLVDEYLFVVGGTKLDGFCLCTVYAFDLVLQVWLRVATHGKHHETVYKHVAEYIPGLDVVMCFGGRSELRFSNDVNCLDVRTMRWKALRPLGTPPAPRSNASSVMVGLTCFIFGGQSGRVTFRDVHLLRMPADGRKASWSSPVVHGQPSKRVDGGLAYLYGGIILFGGQDNVSKRQLNDLYVFDLHRRSWMKGVPENGRMLKGMVVEIRGHRPARRVGHTVTVMPNGVLLVYGGTSAIGGIGGIDTLRVDKPRQA